MLAIRCNGDPDVLSSRLGELGKSCFCCIFMGPDGVKQSPFGVEMNSFLISTSSFGVARASWASLRQCSLFGVCMFLSDCSLMAEAMAFCCSLFSSSWYILSAWWKSPGGLGKPSIFGKRGFPKKLGFKSCEWGDASRNPLLFAPIILANSSL